MQSGFNFDKAETEEYAVVEGIAEKNKKYRVS
jgi:hypothetical protein